MTVRAITPLRARQFLLTLLGLPLLWPAVINGGPFLFPDTSAYVRGVDASMVRLVGHQTGWSNADVIGIAQRLVEAAPDASSQAGTAREGKPVLLGRSVFYGVLPYAGALAGSLWLTICLQALLAGGVMLGFLRHFFDPEDERRFALAALAAAAALTTTSLAWFTSMVMPDFLTGLLIVAATAIIVGWRRETRAGRSFWIAVASLGALAHSSHVLLLLALALGGLVGSVVAAPDWRRGAVVIAITAGLGLLGETAFVVGVTNMTGIAPIRPPFLTARLVEDGPGTSYLRLHCDRPRFHLCRYRDRLPLNSDAFLWSKDPATGVFETVPLLEQRALSAEQGAFVAAVVMDRPLGVAGSSLAAVGRQFASWRLGEFNFGSGDAADMARNIPEPERSVLLESRAARHAMPTGFATMLIPLWSIVGLAVIAMGSAYWRTVPAGRYGPLLATGWLADVVLCGALSTPHDRYQARAIWVLAFAAVTIIPALLATWANGQRQPGLSTAD